VRRGQRDFNTYAVEVVLDNSGGKIPVDSQELTIRKSYNCDTDKEEYHLNAKRILEKELFNLFESGGFSLSHHS
jgi:chromosome segregation ATPase